MIESVTDETWIRARRQLLDAEKVFQKTRDDLATQRRALPCRRVNVNYEFDGAEGKVALGDLFGKHSQLLVYHFMYHPDWDAGCKSCTFWADSFDAQIPHLNARDVAFAVISRGPLDKLLAYRKRMQWHFPWLSSASNSFNYDFEVSFTAAQLDSGIARYNYRDGASVGEEMPGISVFRKGDSGEVLHTYSTYARGLDPLNPVYQLLDLVPQGRNEDALPFPMDWVRRHDEY